MSYIRKTIDEWEVQGHYGYGWECVTTEENRREAIERLKEYRANESYPFRLIKKRVPKPWKYCQQVIENIQNPLYCRERATNTVSYQDLKFYLCAEHTKKMTSTSKFVEKRLI